MNIKKWIKNNCQNLYGKKVVLTGATGGIGKEVSFLLSELNAHLILACRNIELAEKLAKEIKMVHQNAKVDFVELDLCNIQSVKNCINNLKKYKGIDILINNAGVYNVPLNKLESGYNNIFEINFVNTYYFTKQLLPELEKKKDAVCITLGSIAHNYAKIDENDIDFSSKRKASLVYGNSKRFLMFSLYELFKDKKVNLSIVHPGITLTNMTSHYHKAINWLVKIGVKLLFPNPKKASLNILYGINHYTVYHEWIGPSLFNIWGKPKIKKLKTCSKKESNIIFQIAEKIYKNII